MTDRPVGPPVFNFTPPPRPDGLQLDGRFARLVPLNAARDGADLHAAFVGHDWIWDYIPVGPFEDEAAFRDFAAASEASTDPVFYAIEDKSLGKVTGFASFLRIDPAVGVIEVGFIVMSPSMQRTPTATEAMVLMMSWAFEAGYRRYEWKCDALNAPSRRAAQRLGFSFEGVFRQATIVKGRNRDTAWFSVIDAEWPALRSAFERWLSPTNFDVGGAQRLALSKLTSSIRAASGKD